MTDDYVRSKIKEALSASGNDKHDAQKLLITWAVRDQALLLGMAKPHLKGIAAALIDHALRTKDSGSRDNGPDNFSKNAIADLAAGPVKDRRAHRNIPPPKSTERQATAMRKLAAAFTRKKK
ncbi:MAG: hypothetical protein AB7H77_04515 [Bdellovibrionales bacterium]